MGNTGLHNCVTTFSLCISIFIELHLFIYIRNSSTFQLVSINVAINPSSFYRSITCFYLSGISMMVFIFPSLLVFISLLLDLHISSSPLAVSARPNYFSEFMMPCFPLSLPPSRSPATPLLLSGHCAVLTKALNARSRLLQRHTMGHSNRPDPAFRWSGVHGEKSPAQTRVTVYEVVPGRPNILRWFLEG